MVADRGIQIKFILQKIQSSGPRDNKSFDNLVPHRNNPLIKVQLNLFKDIAIILNGFLVTFQTDANGAIPQHVNCTKMKSLMRFFILKTIMKTVNTSNEVQQHDVEKSKNLVTLQSIKLTTAAAEELGKVSNNLHDDLKKSFCNMFQAVIKKSKKVVLCSTNLSEMLLA